MKPNIYIRIFLLIVANLLLAGCGNNTEKKYKIGFAQCSGDYWREKTNQDMRMELLNHTDVELDIRNADNDSKRQADDVRYFINNDYDLIILAPNESAPLVEVVKEAKAKGIPVLTFDRRIDSDDFTAHMEVDNYALGKGVAKYAATLGRKPLKIIEIRGPESASPAQLRHKGFMAEVSDHPEMQVICDVFGLWDDGRSYCLTDSLMKLHPDVDLIFAHTDHMALGASRALQEMGRRDVDVVGIDGFPHIGIKGVSEGNLTATFMYPTEGERLLRLALSVLKGEPYERITRVAPLSPIDASNADIVLSQDTLFNERTAKIDILNTQIDQQLEHYNTQKLLLWAFAAITLLLSGLVFVLLKSMQTNRSHRMELELKNAQLQEEKDKQEALYMQLEEATRSKLMFFTNVSHDLRTPLTLIAGPVEQVADDPDLSAKSRSLMQLARKNVAILRRLIDQILDFRKYENGKTDLKLSEVSFPALLKDWTRSFQEVARKRDIRLSYGTEVSNLRHTDQARVESADTVPSVAVDVEKMERIFFNLMSNAFKHTPDNGRISVTFSQTDSEVSYTVKDTGCGIDPSEIERIFDRFYQAEGANPKGSGIGLALTKAFVELHGGSIAVKSENGKGSEFTVTFPVRHTDNEQDTAFRISAEDIETELASIDADTSNFTNEKPTLLVIDDNRDIRTLISEQLRDEYNVLSAGDGLQGVRMATKYVPDIIVCDVMMPVMDGLTCLKELKEEVSTSHIPVLMLTACSMDEQRVQGYEHGADAYMPKPFSLDVLTARCRNLLQNRRRIREIYGKGVKEPESHKTTTPKNVIQRPNDVESEFYSRFVSLVQERLSDPDLQISEIASAMNLGQSQFTRKIKALTNYTPVELVRRMRLQKAKTLLLSSEKTISEIAFEVGFTSPSYFSRCYKEVYGAIPTEVRESRL